MAAVQTASDLGVTSPQHFARCNLVMYIPWSPALIAKLGSPGGPASPLGDLGADALALCAERKGEAARGACANEADPMVEQCPKATTLELSWGHQLEISHPSGRTAS